MRAPAMYTHAPVHPTTHKDACASIQKHTHPEQRVQLSKLGTKPDRQARPPKERVRRQQHEQNNRVRQSHSRGADLDVPTARVLPRTALRTFYQNNGGLPYAWSSAERPSESNCRWSSADCRPLSANRRRLSVNRRQATESCPPTPTGRPENKRNISFLKDRSGAACHGLHGNGTSALRRPLKRTEC